MTALVFLPALASPSVQAAEPVRATMQHDGIERSYLLAAPPVASNVKRPLVLLLHGATGSAEQVWNYTSLPKLAQQNGFVLLAPDGVENRWNDGRQVLLMGKRSTADDAGFLVALIRKAIAENGVNPQRVYITGISNGAMMTYRMLCEYGELFAAAAPVIANLTAAQAASCASPAIVPIHITLATADPLLPWAGGMNKATGVEMLSGPQTYEFFWKRAGCSDTVKAELPNRDPKDGSTITQLNGTGCQQPVQMLQINNGGHQWINGQGGWLLRQMLGPANRDLDGGEAIWNFFRTHAKKD